MGTMDSVKSIIDEVSGLDLRELNENTVINESDITSITIIEAVARIEQDLNIELLPEDLDVTKYKTLGDFFEAVERAIKVNEEN